MFRTVKVVLMAVGICFVINNSARCDLELRLNKSEYRPGDRLEVYLDIEDVSAYPDYVDGTFFIRYKRDENFYFSLYYDHNWNLCASADTVNFCTGFAPCRLYNINLLTLDIEGLPEGEYEFLFFFSNDRPEEDYYNMVDFCKVEFYYGKSNREVEIDDNVFSVSGEDYNVEGDKIVIDNPSKDYQAGDVLFGDEDDRFLLKVLGKEIVDGKTVLMTEQGCIEDAIKEGSLVFDVKPDFSLISNERGYALPRCLNNVNYDVGEYGDINISEAHIYGNDHVDVYIESARLNIKPNLKGDIDYSLNGLEEMHADIVCNVYYDIILRFEVDSGYEYTREANLLNLAPIPVVFVVGGVPVYVDIVLSVDHCLTLKAGVDGVIRAGFFSMYTVQGYMDYVDDNDPLTDDWRISKVQEYFFNPVQEFGINGDFFAEYYLKPKVSFRFYKVGGPYIYFKPYIQAKVHADAGLGNSISGEIGCSIPVGIRGGFGFEMMNVFTRKSVYDQSWDVFDYQEMIFEDNISFGEQGSSYYVNYVNYALVGYSYEELDYLDDIDVTGTYSEDEVVMNINEKSWFVACIFLSKDGEKVYDPYGLGMYVEPVQDYPWITTEIIKRRDFSFLGKVYNALCVEFYVDKNYISESFTSQFKLRDAEGQLISDIILNFEQ